MNTWKRTFVSAFVAQVLSIVGFSFALPFLPFFIGELGVGDTASQAWWAGVTLAATGLTLALFAPLWGYLADRFGRKAMVIRSMFCGTLVLVLMSYSRTIGHLFILRLLQGALTGTVSASVALVASVTPRHRSGFALGMMQAAVLLGVAVGPLLGGMVADTFGYRVAFRVGGLVVLLGGLLVHFAAHEDFTPPDAEERQSLPGFRALLASGGFAAAVLILFAVRYSNTLINPSFPLVVRDLLVSPERLNSITGGIMAAAGLAGAVTAAGLGHVGDRWGHRRIVVICSLAAAVASLGHPCPAGLYSLAAAHLLFGMAVAGTMPAANTMIQQATDPRHMGKAFGAASALSLIGIALGPLTGGFLARAFGLRMPFLAAALCQVLVAVLAVALIGRAARARSAGPPDSGA
ncbi:MAG: MFS transporter [Candidatus Marinimicrobia bacterium]|nr:MFS transporter [Candidatus Neomarinimicrobiota bacterium]